MKALIWIGFCILHYIISSIIKPIVYQIPVTDDRSILLVSTLYGILIAASFGCCFTLAKVLCRKWDLHKESKKAAKEATTASQYNRQALSNEKVEKSAPEVTLNEPEQIEIVAHNIKTTKKVSSKKPAIIVTYVLLIAIIIALSSFCFSTVKVIKIQYDNMNRLADDVYALESELKSTESKLKRKESDLNIAYAKISDNNRLLQNKEDELKTAKSDIEYWKNKYMATDPANVTYSYEFTSVNALLTAIKNAPEAYHNKQAKVFGMILTYESLTFDRKEIALIDNKGESLPDTDDFAARYLYRKKAEAKEAIDVILSSDLQYTVAETGDYVNLYGIVKITNGEVYLDKCQYN